MKAKKLWALLVCLMTAFMLFAFTAEAEGELCTHGEEYLQWKTTANSCTADGKYELVCNFVTDEATGEICGCIHETEIIPAHNYTVIFTSKNANCTEEGQETVYCSWCNSVANRVVPKDNTKHKLSDWETTKAPTCIAEGTKERYCTRGCGYTETVAVSVDTSAHEAAEGSVWTQIKAATCYEEGSESNTCKVCNKTFTRAIPVHSDYNVPAQGYEYNAEKYFKSNVKEATCSQAESAEYTCKSCGTAFTVTGAKAPDKHDFTVESKWEYTEGASCKNPGKLIKHCKHNRNHTVEEDYAPHVFEGYERVITEPGCHKDSEGNTVFTPGLKSVKCIYCDEVEEVAINEEKHSFGDWTYLDGATCTSGGTAERVCTCGEKKETVTFAPYTHLNYTVGYYVAPTCLNRGYEHVVDKECQETYYMFPDGLASKGAHTPGEWEVTKKATCTESGERRLYCDICNEIYKTEVIPQLVHTDIVLKEGFAATCTEPGITDYFYCTSCMRTYEQEVIPAFGHNFVEQYTPGEGAVKICDRCYEYEIIKDDGEQITCNCLCHNSNGLAKTVWKIVTFFMKLFGMNQECKCGAMHY